MPLHFFGYKSAISRFGERFRDGQYNLVSFLFCCSSSHGAPFVKVGARASMPYGVSATESNATQYMNGSNQCPTRRLLKTHVSAAFSAFYI